MTIIADMEALEALPVGETITLTNQGNRRWTRTAEGFQNGEFNLDLASLEPDLGSIQRGIPVESGQMWRDGDGYYLFTGPFDTNVDEWWAVMFYSNGTVYGARTQADFTGTFVEDPQDTLDWWNDTTLGLANSLLYANQAARNAARSFETAARTVGDERVRSLEARVSEVVAERDARPNVDKEAFESDVHEWMNGAGFDHGSGLADVLAEHGFARPAPPRESIDIDVEVSGNTYFTVDQDIVDTYVSDDVTRFDADRLRIDWFTTMTFNVEVDEGDCGCDQVTRDMVETQLRQQGIRFDDLDWDTDCENG